jgi:protein-tyrosine phosphatase
LGASDRALRWESLLNARDLGGLPAAHGHVRTGAIVRSDALYRLNDAGRAALIAHGVRTVIDMRATREIAANSYDFDPASGVTRHHLAQQSAEMWEAVKGRDRADFDLTMLELARPRVATIAQAIADAPPGGVLIHCEVGKDRTGLMTMLLLDLVGTPAEVIAADYSLTATGLAPLFADLIAKAQSDEGRARLQEEALCRADVMAAIHSGFRARYGDAEMYLRLGGAPRATIDAIRARMLGGASPSTRPLTS